MFHMTRTVSSRFVSLSKEFGNSSCALETRSKIDDSNQNLRVSWKPVNPQDCVWKNLLRIIMRTTLQERETIHKFIPVPQAMKIPPAKAAVDQEWEKLEKIPAWDLTKVSSKKRGDR